MPKVKIARKSTWVDMTAFVDVAFLILSFFMLATKFKPDEAVEVKTPTSVSSEVLDEQGSSLILVDKTGRVFLQITDTLAKKDALDVITEAKGYTFTPEQRAKILKTSFIGSSFESFQNDVANDVKQGDLKGIPTANDSLGGELKEWISAVTYSNDKLKWYVKCDSDTRYGPFKQVIDALRSNDQDRFLLVTSPEDVPVGTPLYKANKEMEALMNKQKK